MPSMQCIITCKRMPVCSRVCARVVIYVQYSCFEKNRELTILIEIVPVSYTHLDVYKRQGLYVQQKNLLSLKRKIFE